MVIGIKIFKMFLPFQNAIYGFLFFAIRFFNALSDLKLTDFFISQQSSLKINFFALIQIVKKFSLCIIHYFCLLGLLERLIITLHYYYFLSA